MADQKPGEPQTPVPQADGDPQTPVPADGDPAPHEEPAPSPEQMMALADATQRHPFGPAFFMAQLRGFAGEGYPNPVVARPMVEIHLDNGDVLDLCHIIGVTPQWVALAVRDGDDDDRPGHVRTEFIAYDSIRRVTLRPARPEAPQLGFEASRAPRLLAESRPGMTPEESIRAAAAGSPEPTGD